jgi:MFS family permease
VIARKDQCVIAAELDTRELKPIESASEPSVTAVNHARGGDERALPEPSTRLGFWEVLRLPAFGRLWLAQLCGRLGEAIALVAMPLLVYALTGSAELLSLIFILQLVPRIVLAPIAGVLADRLDRRRVILSADVARAALVALLLVADQPWQIAVLATLVAIGTAIAGPAELAAVPMVVPPGQLVPALSITQVAASVVRIVGPTLAAGIIALTGPRAAFAAQALCFVVSAGAIFGLALPPVARSSPTASPLERVVREMAEGLHIVWRNPIVRGIAAVEALWQIVFAVFVVTALVYVAETLRLGSEGPVVYSTLMAMFGAGTAVGALVARRVEDWLGRPRLMAIGYLAPLLLIPAVLTPPLPVLFACWLTLGFLDAWAVIAMQTYLAEAVPDALRGRVYATWTGMVTLGGAAGFALVGWVTPRLGAPLTLALAGAVVGLGGPLLLLITGALAAVRCHRPPADEAAI